MVGRQRIVEIGDEILHLLREVLCARVAALADGQGGDLIAAGRAPDPQVDAPRIKRLQHAELLRHLERAVVGQQHAAGADPDPGGLGGDAREQDLRAGIGKRGDRVMLGEPVAVEAQLLGRPREPDRLVDGLRRGVSADDG